MDGEHVSDCSIYVLGDCGACFHPAVSVSIYWLHLLRVIIDWSQRWSGPRGRKQGHSPVQIWDVIAPGKAELLINAGPPPELHVCIIRQVWECLKKVCAAHQCRNAAGPACMHVLTVSPRQDGGRVRGRMEGIGSKPAGNQWLTPFGRKSEMYGWPFIGGRTAISSTLICWGGGEALITPYTGTGTHRPSLIAVLSKPWLVVRKRVHAASNHA